MTLGVLGYTGFTFYTYCITKYKYYNVLAEGRLLLRYITLSSKSKLRCNFYTDMTLEPHDDKYKYYLVVP